MSNKAEQKEEQETAPEVDEQSSYETTTSENNKEDTDYTRVCCFPAKSHGQQAAARQTHAR